MSDVATNQPKKPYGLVDFLGDFGRNAAAGAGQAVNQLLFGAPQWALGKISPETEKAYQAFIESAPVGKTIGDVAGTLGSIILPGGVLARGANLGLRGALALAPKAAPAIAPTQKVLSQVSKFMNAPVAKTGSLAKKIGQGAAVGGANAAEQSILRAAFAPPAEAEIRKGEIGSDIATGAAVSAALGPILGKLVKVRPISKSINQAEINSPLAQAAEELDTALNKLSLSNTGISTRALRRAVGSKFGSVKSQATQGPKYVKEVSEFAKERGIKTKTDWKNLIKTNEAGWDNLYEEIDKTLPQNWQSDLSERLLNNQDFNRFISEQATTPGVDVVLQKVLKSNLSPNAPNASLGALRNKLGSYAKNIYNPRADIAQTERGIAASILKNTLDDYIIEQSGLPPELLANLKQEYKYLQPFLQQEARDAGQIEGIGGGSQTFEKFAADKLLGNTFNKVAGGGIGGVVAGGLSTTEDYRKGEELNVPKALLNLAVGSVAGPLAGKLSSRIFSRGIVGAGRALAGRSGEYGTPEGVARLESLLGTGATIPARAAGVLTAQPPQPESQAVAVPQPQLLPSEEGLSPIIAQAMNRRFQNYDSKIKRSGLEAAKDEPAKSQDEARYDYSLRYNIPFPEDPNTRERYISIWQIQNRDPQTGELPEPPPYLLNFDPVAVNEKMQTILADAYDPGETDPIGIEAAAQKAANVLKQKGYQERLAGIDLDQVLTPATPENVFQSFVDMILKTNLDPSGKQRRALADLLYDASENPNITKDQIIKSINALSQDLTPEKLKNFFKRYNIDPSELINFGYNINQGGNPQQ